MKKRLIALTVVLAMLLSVAMAIMVGCNKDNKTLQSAPKFVKAADSDDGFATVYMPSSGGIKIMVLSDPQVDTTEKYKAVGSLGNDATFAFIEDLISSTNPDLVVINGDMVMSSVPFLQGNGPLFKRYCEIFEKLEVPWMPVFGNHDSEQGYSFSNVTIDDTRLNVTKDVLVDFLSSYDHCLMSSDEDCEDGFGNYFVNIRDRSGNLVYTLCAFDCVYSSSGVNGEYEYVPTAKQIEWYENTINEISDTELGLDRNGKTVKSMIFNHVGIPEFKTAYDLAYNGGNPTEDYFYGYRLQGNYTNNESGKADEDKFFNRVKALGSTTAIFMAHHHDNDFSVNYQGIRLTFGQHSGVAHNYRTTHGNNGVGVSEWTDVNFSRVDNYGDNRGGTQTTITADGEFEIEPIYARNVISNYLKDYYIDYDAVAEQLENNPDYSTGIVIRGSERKWKIEAQSSLLAA